MYFVVYHIKDSSEPLLDWWVEGPCTTMKEAESKKEKLEKDKDYDQIYITMKI